MTNMNPPIDQEKKQILLSVIFAIILSQFVLIVVWAYLRYGLEGYIGAIYGENRGVLDCDEAAYCHYRYPKKFLDEITMRGDQFYNDVIALVIIMVIFRTVAFFVLKAKIQAVK